MLRSSQLNSRLIYFFYRQLAYVCFLRAATQRSARHTILMRACVYPVAWSPPLNQQDKLSNKDLLGGSTGSPASTEKSLPTLRARRPGFSEDVMERLNPEAEELLWSRERMRTGAELGGKKEDLPKQGSSTSKPWAIRIGGGAPESSTGLEERFGTGEVAGLKRHKPDHRSPGSPWRQFCLMLRAWMRPPESRSEGYALSFRPC